jgi:MFS family permease
MSGLLGPPLAGMVRDRRGYAAVFIGLSVLILTAALFAGSVLRSRSGPPAKNLAFGTAWRSLLRLRLSVSFFAAFSWMFMMGTLLVFLPLIGEGRGFTAAQVGMLFGSFALMTVLVQASPLGRLSDRWGRLPIVALGLLLLATALLALRILRAWGAMMGAMALYGLGFGFLFPAMSAMLVDETTPETRGGASGVFMAMISVGMIVGSGMAGLMDRWHQAVGVHPFQIAAIVVFLALLWTAVVGLVVHRTRHTPFS